MSSKSCSPVVVCSATSKFSKSSQVELDWDIYDSVIGSLIIMASKNKLCSIFLPESKNGNSFQLCKNIGNTVQDACNPIIIETKAQLGEYFSGQRKTFDLPLCEDCGTTFQRLVWSSLLDIPYGTTVSYGQQAEMMGFSTTSARAVGVANGKNPLPIILPCHRVIGKSGFLVGYGGGLNTKAFLIELESRNA